MANIITLGQITEDDIFNWMKKYEKRQDGYYCKQCGCRIQQTKCRVSVHLKMLEPEHIGHGQLCYINYPYCPTCDGKIDYATACFHIGQEVYAMIESDSGVN